MKYSDATGNEIAEWHKAGLALREKLEGERSELRKRLAQVEDDLRLLPSEVTQANGSAGRNGASEEARSVPEMVMAIVRNSPVPVPASVVMERVREHNARVDPRNVHSALYRLAKLHQIKATGRKGSMLYSGPGGG